MSDEGELVDARDLLLDQRLRSLGRAEAMTRLVSLRTRHADCLWAIERTVEAEQEQQLREHARELARAIVVIADELGSPCGDIAGGIVLLPTSSVVTTRIVTPAQVPGCGQEHQPAWRTAAAAEAARARMHDPSAWRPSWVASVPDTRTDEGFRLLTFDAWRAVGGPAVATRDHFAAHPWAPGETRLHVLAAPPEDIRRRIHAAYQKILADQWGCAAVPADWLHLPLCGAATGVDAGDQEHAAEQLAAWLREGADDKLLQGIELVLGPATVNADGVQLDISSPGPTGPEVFEARDEPLGQLVNQVRALAHADAIDRHWRPNLALAYTRADRGTLDATGIHHVRRRWAWQLDALHVAAVTQHPTDGCYQWDILDTIALPGAP